MQYTTQIEVLATLGEQGFTLDELVHCTRDLFEREGMAGLIGLLLELVDEVLFMRLAEGTKGWRPPACCKEPSYELHSREHRKRLRTSAGNVAVRWRRLRCRHCRQSVVPLRSFLGLERWQSKSGELERMVTEVVSEQSYRRSVAHLDGIGMIPVPKSSAHRWVVHSPCDELHLGDQRFESLLADGTGYKRRPDPEAGMSNRGEIKVLLGVVGEQVVPLGAWSGQNWERVAAELQQYRSGDPEPIAHTLITDGEPGLPEALASFARMHQRCQWHQIQDLNVLMWHDKAPLKERRKAQKRIAGILQIELPEQDFEEVAKEDKLLLEQEVQKAERRLQRLAREIEKKGYGQAATYVRNAKSRLFSYVRLWLETGLVSPRVNSVLERMMREIGRRLKRIAHGWSEEGAAKMTRIILKRMLSPEDWIDYWQQRLGLDGNVHLILRAVRTA
jgi:hypothetical protein